MRQLDDQFAIHDDAFVSVIGKGARLVRVANTDAHEGPVYVPAEDSLYFTTLPRRGTEEGHGSPEVAIKRLELDGERFPLCGERETVVVSRANGANGMTLAPDGSLIVCEQGTTTSAARIAALDPT